MCIQMILIPACSDALCCAAWQTSSTERKVVKARKVHMLLWAVFVTLKELLLPLRLACHLPMGEMQYSHFEHFLAT